MKQVILDLDSTLCNIDHRIQYYNSQEWEKYNSLIPNDTLNEKVYNIVMDLYNQEYQIIILTGRYERYRGLTQEWLRLNTSFPYKMIMKNNNDNKSSIVFKNNWISKYCDETDIVIDDRPEIKELCEKLNIGYITPITK